MFRQLLRWAAELPTTARAILADIRTGRKGYGTCDGCDDGKPKFGVAWYASEGCWVCARMYLTTPILIMKGDRT